MKVNESTSSPASIVLRPSDAFVFVFLMAKMLVFEYYSYPMMVKRVCVTTWQYSK